MLAAQSTFAAEVYKEQFPGGVYIHDGDEPYVNALDIPGGPKKTKFSNTDLIINTIGKGVYDKWSDKQALALSYCISNKFGANKARVIEAVRIATDDWMSAANVKFIYLSKQDAKCDHTNTKVLFDIRPIAGQPYLARAFFPNTKRISRNILIDTSSFKHDDIALTGFLRHELGHTLGFRHEHISKNSKRLCDEDDSFNPLTSYDPGSVMHYPQCGGTNVITNMVLSSLDAQGAASVYPFK